MKYIFTLNEYKDDSKGSFYILFDELVYVDDINRWGDEIKVEYTREDGSHHTYIGDDRDFKEDFIETTDTFNFNINTTIEHPAIPQPSQEVKSDKCNLVFYIGKTKLETIRTNIDSKLAYALKNTYSKDPKYKSGRIEVEKI